MIDILVPVLSRPTRAQPLADSVHQNTTVPYALLFLTSPDDHAQYRACLDTGANVLQVEDSNGGSYPTKINVGYKVTANPFLLLAADDLEFTPGWDEVALKVAEISGRGVVGTNDMANPHVMKGEFSTHPLVRREYIREQGGSLDGPGIVYSESYHHNYVDVELAGLAQSRDEWAFALESKVIHHHPSFAGTLKADSTYLLGRSNFAKDARLFRQRQRQWKKGRARR